MAPQYVIVLFRAQISQYEMRDNQRMSLPHYNTATCGKNSFRYFEAKLWKNRNDTFSLNLQIQDSFLLKIQTRIFSMNIDFD